MDLPVFLAVLAAAAMHAGWNALVKGSGGDPLRTITHMACCTAVLAAACVPIVGLPRPAAWPWLAASVVLHTLYRFALIEAYKAGDMAQVYPIARGAAPLMTAVATAALYGERLPVLDYVGIAALAVGVFLMSLKGGRLGHLEPRAVATALVTSLTITGYTYVDGVGARINGSGPNFAIWEFLLGSATWIVISLLWRGRASLAGFGEHWRAALGGSLMSTTAYFIAIWAMTKAPIAEVAALRETSVLFAALIAVVLLGEKMTPWRIVAAVVIVAGVVAMRLA